MNREQTLRRWIKLLTWLFVVGLFLSGATAIPLVTEVNWLAKLTGAQQLLQTPAPTDAPYWAVWLVKVQSTLHEASDENPILFYGTDWLAFGHFVIAFVFVGALRDPVKTAGCLILD